MRFLAVLVAALALVPAGTTRSAGGLYGVVKRSPAMPHCGAEEQCTKPVSGATLVFSGVGRSVARVTSGVSGGYRLVLARGVYAVRVQLRGLSVRVTPTRVTVSHAGFVRVDFLIDTGIR
jgi:hypothetical protein